MINSIVEVSDRRFGGTSLTQSQLLSEDENLLVAVEFPSGLSSIRTKEMFYLKDIKFSRSVCIEDISYH